MFISSDLEESIARLKETRSVVNILIIKLICVLVRVGGGYLSIDEFLDIYTPMELERLERNDPIKKFMLNLAKRLRCRRHWQWSVQYGLLEITKET